MAVLNGKCRLVCWRIMKDDLKAKTCSQFFKGLADPERLKIVERLQDGPSTVSELTLALHSELANVSHHLSVLRKYHLVCTKRNGKNILYSLNPTVFSRQKNSRHSLNFGCCEVVLRSR